MMVRTLGSSRMSRLWPGVATKILPWPHWRVQMAGEVTSRCHGSHGADLLGGRGQDVDVGVGEHPVLLGDQVEVVDAGGDRVVGRGRQHVDAVRHVVVRRSPTHSSGCLPRVAGELAADQVQVVRGVAVRVGDAAVPAGQAGPALDRGLQPGELVRLDGAMVMHCMTRSTAAIGPASA